MSNRHLTYSGKRWVVNIKALPPTQKRLHAWRVGPMRSLVVRPRERAVAVIIIDTKEQ